MAGLPTTQIFVRVHLLNLAYIRTAFQPSLDSMAGMPSVAGMPRVAGMPSVAGMPNVACREYAYFACVSD